MGGAIIGRDVGTGEGVRLTDAARRGGLAIIGKQGMGKTTLLISLMQQDLQAGTGFCLLDPHRDASFQVLSLIPPERQAAVIILDLHDIEYPFSLNLFAGVDPANLEQVAQTEDRIMQIFARQFGEFTDKAQLEETLSAGLLTILANPGHTLAELPRLLQDAAFRNQLLHQATELDDQVRLFWQRFKRGYADAAQRRLSRLVGKRTLRNLLGQTASIDFRQAMDQGKILIVRLDAAAERDTKLIGSLLLSQLLSAALSRSDLPEANRRQFHLYCDEYAFFATPATLQMIAQARKFGVATTLALQDLTQLPPEQRHLLEKVTNLAVFNVSDADSRALAGSFAVDPTPAPKVLKKAYEPVMKRWTEVVWEPAEAEEHYSALRTRWRQVMGELHVLARSARLVAHRVDDYDRWDAATELAWVPAADVERLSAAFNQCPPDYATRRPPDAALAEAIARDGRSDVPYHFHWVDPNPAWIEKTAFTDKFFRKPAIKHYCRVVGKDAVGYSRFRLPASWPSVIERELAGWNDSAVVQKLRADIASLVAPTKGQTVYRYRPDDPQSWAVEPHDCYAWDYPKVKEVSGYWERGQWETVAMPEAVAWLKQHVQTLLVEAAALKAQWQAVWDDCRQEIEHAEYQGYDLPKTAIEYRTDSAGYRKAYTVPRYEWVEEKVTSPSAMRANIAGYLANLPAHQARVKLRVAQQAAETTITPIPVAAVPNAVAQARISALYAHSRASYAQPRAVVEATIRARQQVAPQPAPAPTAQPFGSSATQTQSQQAQERLATAAVIGRKPKAQ